MTKEKRIPTILGLLLLVAGTAAGIFLSSSSQILNTKASGDCRPDQVQFTNITNQSASVSFKTSDTCISNIKINGAILEDYRQQVLSQTAPAKTKLHYYQVPGLKENTTYQFEIISGGSNFNDSSYRFKTAQKPSADIPSANLAWGRVLDTASNPASGSILFLNIPGSGALSALVTSAGNWNISLASSFNQGLTNWFTPQPGIDEEIVVLSETTDQTVITANTSNNNPVPDIILGQNYLSAPLAPQYNPSNLLTTVTAAPNLRQLNITYPQEGEAISSLKPEIIGTGPQNSTITIRVSNFTQSWEVTPDSTGSWRWTPPSGLLPGSNIVTVLSSSDQLSRSFSVSTNNGLSFTASSSATPTLIPEPTQAPTITIMPTPIPTNPPTATPTRARSTRPSTESGVPQTGVESLTFVFILSSIILLFVSLHLFKKSANF